MAVILEDKVSIVFFGSGPVAAASLQRLAEDFIIEAVITKPQPPHHKVPFPVLSIAADLKLKVFTPNSKQELSKLFQTNPVTSRLGVVIDYGFIINQDVIDYFPLGIVNSHFSLLPEWRGADPITFSILSGQERTGVSLMLITAGMDEGPLLSQGTYDIRPDITTPGLTNALIELSDQLIKRTLPAYIRGQIIPVAQEEATLASVKSPTYSRKLTKEDGIIDWSKTARQIEREIRAFIEWPKSRVKLGRIEVILTKAYVVPSIPHGSTPGDITIVKESGIIMVATGDGSLCIERLKPIGKKEMPVKAFLAGYKIITR